MAVTKMVIGIKNSIKLAFMITTPNTESNKAKVWPIVKMEIKINTLFQSLKAYGTVSAIKNKT